MLLLSPEQQAKLWALNAIAGNEISNEFSAKPTFSERVYCRGSTTMLEGGEGEQPLESISKNIHEQDMQSPDVGLGGNGVLVR